MPYGKILSQVTEREPQLTRRSFIVSAAKVGVAAIAGGFESSFAAPSTIQLPFANGARSIVSNFPQKGSMILQRTRPPLLETPFEVFDQGVFTPNDRFYVRWHLADVPSTIDPASFRLTVQGHVEKRVSFSVEDLVRDLPPYEIAAVNQCAGNSRGFFGPRVVGAQWGNGAMGNALWRGVRLRDVLDRAGVRAGAVQVRFKGMDSGVTAETPAFLKSLSVDHARDGEVMIAYEMNDSPLPLLNGYPLRLVVPGWYATYWVKMLTDIEVLDHSDDSYWMTKAYLIPDTPRADVSPDAKNIRTIPISAMVPRSFVTNVKDGAAVERGSMSEVRGIAFGGDAELARVLISTDEGQVWKEARLGRDHGAYSFRQWRLPMRFSDRGHRKIMVRAVNSRGDGQPDQSNWNAGGYMRNVIETVSLNVV